MKEKRNELHIKTKLQSLKHITNGESVRQICHELNVGKSTVYQWQKNHKWLQEFS